MQHSIVRTKNLYEVFGKKVTQRAIRDGWIGEPKQKRHRYTLWPDDSIQVIKIRLERGDYPPPLQCELPGHLRGRKLAFGKRPRNSKGITKTKKKERNN